MRATSAETHLPPAPERRHGAARGRGALLLACGNPLRQDDGVGWRIAEAVQRLTPDSRMRIILAQQWTPEMAADLSRAELAIFVDASAADDAGAIRVTRVCVPGGASSSSSSSSSTSISTPSTSSSFASLAPAESHGMEPDVLMALAQRLYGHAPARAFVVTVGAASFGYGEEISGSVRQAVPRAARLVGNLVAAAS